MIITKEEEQALRWWIDWTKEEIERIKNYSVEMERGGETEKGSVARMRSNQEVVLDLRHRL